MKIYAPKLSTYEGGSPYTGISMFERGSYESASSNCSDVQTAIADFGMYTGDYPVECDFTALDGTGAVFFADPDTMIVQYAVLVSENETESDLITIGNLQTIMFVEVGFMLVFILVNFVARQFVKVRKFINKG